MPQEAPFLTVSQATERLSEAGLNVSRDTVQRWCRDKKLPSVTLPGGYYRIRVEDVDALLQVDPADTEAGVA